jgi:SnoaL-like domain
MAALTRDDVQRWIDGYIGAWSTNEPDAIAALFTEDAEYHDRPFGPATHGRDEIVAHWLAGRDEPGTWQASIHPFAVDTAENIGLATGTVQYDTGRSFSNLWVIHLGPDGRAFSFSEWWIEQPHAEV